MTLNNDMVSLGAGTLFFIKWNVVNEKKNTKKPAHARHFFSFIVYHSFYFCQHLISNLDLVFDLFIMFIYSKKTRTV